MSSRKLGIRVTVGQKKADIIGKDNRALQAAVDTVAALGGGLVEIGAGTYTMHDSLHLKSHVTVRGQGEDTLLVKAPAAESKLILDGDYGEEQVTLENPEGFQPGYGISVTDDDAGGFHTVVGTIIWAEGNTFGVNDPMRSDYMVHNNARAATTFPVVEASWKENVAIENLAVDGNKAQNPWLNGCRGAGIFLIRSHGTRIQGCTVRDFHGDGISFQQSQEVVVEDCVVTGATHLGLHPGSGSQKPVIRNCKATENDKIGLYLCWRVKHGVFDDNILMNNGDTGISIGHKDTDNIFRRNRSVGNGREGVLFRNESEPMAGHRNTFEDNEILDNGGDEASYGVRIMGVTHDLCFRNNRIGGTGRQKVGVFIGKDADRIQLEDNDLTGNSEQEVEDMRATA